MHHEGGHVVASAVEAWVGVLGKPTLAVLIVSTAMTVELFAIIYGLVFAT
jgi:hypothetical protein